MVAPDLKQNILVTVYLLFSHNYIALAYFTGLVISIALSIWKPSRFTTFCFLGFAILLFSYEYDKHIIDALREQTVKSLVTVQPHYRLTHYLNLTITELLPILFYVTGWFFIFLAIFYAAKKIGENKKK